MSLTRRQLLMGAAFAISAGDTLVEEALAGDQKEVEKAIAALKTDRRPSGLVEAQKDKELMGRVKSIGLKIDRSHITTRKPGRKVANLVNASTIVQKRCFPNTINQLGIKASWFSFYVSAISWKAGQGHAVYHEYCPHDDYDKDRMFCPNAKIHQIVPLLFGVEGAVCLGCDNPGKYAGTEVGEITFMVNDVHETPLYLDNAGYFDVQILAWG